MPRPRTLANIIIFGSDDEVATALQTQNYCSENDSGSCSPINEIDEYGYTPLIQCAIVNSINKTRLLLDAGAHVDMPDLTGRTALHWAASNSNRPLCELLLQRGANANAYSYAGQPALVIPWLKKSKPTYQQLLKSGANIDFAQDFINAKVLGHRFELEGRVDIVDPSNTFIEVELEGFYLEFSLNLIASSLIDFRSNFGSKKLRKYFAKFDVIINALHNAVMLIKYQHYLVDAEKSRKQIDPLLDREPLILPVTFDGHAITLIKFWEWLIRCDRGAFGRENGTVIIYYMKNPHAFTQSFTRNLLYKRQYTEHLNTGLVSDLDLHVMWRLPLSPQTVGNCTWANIEATIPALMFLFLLEENGGRDAERCEKEALEFYNEWVEWDKGRALHFCVTDIEETTPARRAAKAALLAAVLFQACAYEKQQDRAKVEKVLPILIQPDYKYILQSYIKVFAQDPKNPMLKSLYNFLDDYGVIL